MTCQVINFADERIIRRMPDRPLSLDPSDLAYLSNCLRAIDSAFSLPAHARVTPHASLMAIPARKLARRLIEARRALTPTTPDQRAAHGALWSAIALLNTARALHDDRGRWRG